MPRVRILGMLVISALMIAGLTVLSSTYEKPAEAAVASDFDPGNIISDQNFYDGAAMSASQIQSFLTQRVPSCRSNYACLSTYRQNTPTMPATAYCRAIPGQANETAASIIARVGSACGVSQRVLLVLLEKEQSLVSSASPVQRQFDKATGFACPDTAPCDPSFNGFSYQVYYAARQFNLYQARPNNYRHVAGKSNQVLYHPNAACGSSSVFIQNQATAGLYNYTPYQPNTAALDNLYGSGNTCSSYGNRNFWRIFTDWFGDPRQSAHVAFWQASGDARVYLVSEGTKYLVPNRAMLSEYQGLGIVQQVTAARLNGLATGMELGRIIVGASGKMYFVDGSTGYHIRSCGDLQAWGFGCGSFPRIGAALEQRLRDGGVLHRTVTLPDGSAWGIEGAKKRQLVNVSVANSFGFGNQSTRLSSTALNGLPVGVPVVPPGYAVRNSDRSIAYVSASNGLWRASSAQKQLGFLYNAPVFTTASMNQLRHVGNLPDRVLDGAVGFVVSDAGMLRVHPPHYGGTSRFAQWSAGIASSMPRAGEARASHFVREQGTDGIYLVSGNTMRVMPNQAEYQRVIRTGVPARVWNVPPRSLADVPQRTEFPSGTLIRVPDQTTVYMIDGGRALRVPQWANVEALGLPTTVRQVPVGVLAGFSSTSVRLDTLNIQCGSTSYFASGAGLHPWSSLTARNHLGMPVLKLQDPTCAVLKKFVNRATQFVSGKSGGTYMIQDGKLRYINSGATLASVGGNNANRIGVPNHILRLIPEGTWVRPTFPDGTLIQSQNGGPVYVQNGPNVMELRTYQISKSLGLGTSPVRLQQAGVNATTKVGTLSSSIIRCGTVLFVGVNGARQAVPQQFVGDYKGIAVNQLSSSLCAKIPVSGQRMTEIVQGNNGVMWLLDNGKRHQIQNQAALTRLGGHSNGWRVVDDTVIAAFPVGSAISR
ncbi:hypothetical protein [Humidisolicoccus flavus]|uniref:hypothetical protein n=1 Tax=Humidisolicoccus flavus TaxID=3111414 RepID=UPI003245F4C7